MNTIYIYVNGIMNFPGGSKNWNGRAVTWTHINTEAKAEKIEYFCGPVGRAFGQKERAEKLAATLSFYKGWKIILIGHSNGTDVILKALAQLEWPRVEALHLVSAACEADFYKNGLNEAMMKGLVGRVYVYLGGKDMALKAAHSIFGRLLGYGTLGLTGPKNVSAMVKAAVTVTTWGEYGHSDCFDDKNFDGTMRVIAV